MVTIILPPERPLPEALTALGTYAHMETDMTDTPSVRVETKPWYESKINWTAAIGVVVTIATLFGYTVPPDLVTQTAVGLVAIQGVLTFVFKTWFTSTVTPASVGK